MIVTIVTKAKCKDCKFAKRHQKIKKNGSISKLSKTVCENSKSPRKFENIKQTDLVCEQWELLYS